MAVEICVPFGSQSVVDGGDNFIKADVSLASGFSAKEKNEREKEEERQRRHLDVYSISL